MKISDSDKPKLIVLICLIILVPVYFGYRMMGVKKPTATVKSASENTVKNAVTGVQPEIVEPQQTVIMAKARDPFQPQVVPSSDIKTNKPNIKSNIRLPIYGGNNLVQLPPIVVKPGGNPVIVVPEALPNFLLVGVVTGDRNLAVIKGDGSSSYMVYEGQYIEGKYLIKSISTTSVSIQFRDRITVLKLGGKDAVQN